jgi:hypothetical protein
MAESISLGLIKVEIIPFKILFVSLDENKCKGD